MGYEMSIKGAPRGKVLEERVRKGTKGKLREGVREHPVTIKEKKG